MLLRKAHKSADQAAKPGYSRKSAALMGLSRLGFGALMLGRPVLATTALGLDSATATRIVWLARMTAARDIALGAGALDAGLRGADGRPWLVAGAGSDLVDAVALTMAVRDGRLPAVRAGGMAALAVGAAVAGFALAGLPVSRRSRRR